MKYYEVIVKLAHCGVGNFRLVPVYVSANNAIKAMDLARKLPGIKHHSFPYSVKEISKQEYKECREKNIYKKTIQNNLGKEDEEGNNLYGWSM